MAGVSDKTVGRLSLYRRTLLALQRNGETHIHSKSLADSVGLNAAQVRRDLMEIGANGTPAKGYSIAALVEKLNQVFHVDEQQNIALAGVGNLGRALLDYFPAKRPNAKIMAAFDADPHKTGRVIVGCHCYPVEEMKERIRAMNITLGIIPVPATPLPHRDLAAISAPEPVPNLEYPARRQLPLDLVPHPRLVFGMDQIAIGHFAVVDEGLGNIPGKAFHGPGNPFHCPLGLIAAYIQDARNQVLRMRQAVVGPANAVRRRLVRRNRVFGLDDTVGSPMLISDGAEPDVGCKGDSGIGFIGHAALPMALLTGLGQDGIHLPLRRIGAADRRGVPSHECSGIVAV